MADTLSPGSATIGCAPCLVSGGCGILFSSFKSKSVLRTVRSGQQLRDIACLNVEVGAQCP
ncbi:hypothetical protein HCU01_00370 [Halomonas cupida]|uniref:Uncharacterized protein n=1 Tax=Halomonas cupida TaxID=44933 RepID=A0ABQ0WBL8_9GAMM|nr:hypothetical protein HCU01_00370 [Halomonas cupida]